MSSHSETDLVDRLTLRAANDGEALISAARTVFCLLVLGRFLALDDVSEAGGKFAIEVPLLALASLASAFGFVKARQGRLRTQGLIVWSVADALVCFGSLLPNVLWPDERYIGLLRIPDVAVLLPVVFISALRLTPIATLASLGANLASLGGLVAIDLAVNASRLEYGGRDITMVLILLLTVGAATWATARGARSLVRRAARETAQLGRARRHLNALLREHHDVRTLLSTARMNLQLARRQPSSQDERLSIVEAAIVELGDFVEGVKSQAFAELAIIEGIVPADVTRVVQAAAQVAQRRFPATCVECDAPAVNVDMVGGERALLQVVFNLLANACEGEGSRRATRVRLDGAVQDRRVTLRVEDDGPGFLPELLASGATLIPSTKAGGSGMGLMLVSELVTASGGRLELRNNDVAGGASVTLHLPLSQPEAA